jgi:hypothetical protein
MPAKYHYRLPGCYKRETDQILEIVNKLSASHKIEANNFINKHGIKTLCIILYSIRGWYSAWSYTHAERLLKHRNALEEIMNFNLPKGLVRGIRIWKNKPYKKGDIDTDTVEGWKDGDDLWINITRNHGVASFTSNIQIARKFAGKTKKYIGVIVKLEKMDANGKVLLAPPSKTKKWFNILYSELIGKSFREKEDEYVIKADRIKVKVLKINR